MLLHILLGGWLICVAFISAYEDFLTYTITPSPLIVSHLLCGLYLLFFLEIPPLYLIGYLAVVTLFYGLLNSRKVWGSGDSDLMMVLCDSVLISISPARDSMLAAVFYISLALAAGCAASVLVFFLSRREDPKKTSKVAAAPGMAAVLALIVTTGGML